MNPIHKPANHKTMKPLLITLLCSAIFLRANAQASINVFEEKSVENPNEVLFTTEILGFGEDFVLWHWLDFLQAHGGKSAFVQNEKGNFQMDTVHVEFPPMGNETVNIKTQLTPNATETGVNFAIGISNGQGKFLNSSDLTKTEYRDLKNWMLAFNRYLRTTEKEEIFNAKQMIHQQTTI